MKLSLLTITITIAAAAFTVSIAHPSSGSSSYFTITSCSNTDVKGDPTAQQIFDSINSWINDVHNVNCFLNRAVSLTGDDLVSGAQTALSFASNEPFQLAIESKLPNLSQEGKDAVAALQKNFGGVITSLDGIITDPNNRGSVNGFFKTINTVRCNIVLPSLDALWPAAAKASGASPNRPRAERPNACSQ